MKREQNIFHRTLSFHRGNCRILSIMFVREGSPPLIWQFPLKMIFFFCVLPLSPLGTWQFPREKIFRFQLSLSCWVESVIWCYHVELNLSYTCVCLWHIHKCVCVLSYDVIMFSWICRIMLSCWVEYVVHMCVSVTRTQVCLCVVIWCDHVQLNLSYHVIMLSITTDKRENHVGCKLSHHFLSLSCSWVI